MKAPYSNILITGGAGFVGSNLALHLRAHSSANIVAFDNLHRRGSELNVERLLNHGVMFVHGDIRCAADFEGVPRPDLIIECSAEPSAQAGYGGGSPRYLMETNLAGCFQCLELARSVRSDVIFVSTSRVYPVKTLNDLRFRETETRFQLDDEQSVPGASSRGIAEDFPLSGARSLYGMTKLAAELMVEEYAAAYGFRAAILRCGVISGPWQMGKVDQGVIALWVAAHHFGRPLRYIGYGGTGKQVRDAMHVADVCELIAMQCRDMDRFNGCCLNAGGGALNSASLLELTALCQQVTGRQVEITSEPETRVADVRVYITDHSRLTGLCGWRPQRSVADIVTDIHGWIRANEDLVRRVLQ